MQWMVTYLATLGASLFLFPLEWYILLKRAQQRLARRRIHQEQAAARHAWLFWALQARQCLKRKDAVRQQVQTLTQALAASEHYLDTASPSAEPRVYRRTQQVCREMQRKLHHLQCSTKKGPGRK